MRLISLSLSHFRVLIKLIMLVPLPLTISLRVEELRL
ncbi:hypothetical protein Goshw_020209 [Gossypium schwendimanii]|uniref:Uncharacterized protein n=1 Tax=Gossypium schwendimanii TaxID=34291 RepID=A0A7J9KTA5_GOSSC|nr:hypothetical protein [Gossypium schwendimanii]